MFAETNHERRITFMTSILPSICGFKAMVVPACVGEGGHTGHVGHVGAGHAGIIGSAGHCGHCGHNGQLRLPKKLENAPNVFPVALPEFPEKKSKYFLF